MTTELTRRSSTQRLLLKMHPGKTLREILQHAYEQHGTLAGAAESLGINEGTFSTWLNDVGLRIEVKVERRGRLVAA